MSMACVPERAGHAQKSSEHILESYTFYVVEAAFLNYARTTLEIRASRQSANSVGGLLDFTTFQDSSVPTKQKPDFDRHRLAFAIESGNRVRVLQPETAGDQASPTRSKTTLKTWQKRQR